MFPPFSGSRRMEILKCPAWDGSKGILNRSTAGGPRRERLRRRRSSSREKMCAISALGEGQRTSRRSAAEKHRAGSADGRNQELNPEDRGESPRIRTRPTGALFPEEGTLSCSRCCHFWCVRSSPVLYNSSRPSQKVFQLARRFVWG